VLHRGLRACRYSFVALFIYVVLNIFIAIIEESFFFVNERGKEIQEHLKQAEAEARALGNSSSSDSSDTDEDEAVTKQRVSFRIAKASSRMWSEGDLSAAAGNTADVTYRAPSPTLVHEPVASRAPGVSVSPSAHGDDPHGQAHSHGHHHHHHKVQLPEEPLKVPPRLDVQSLAAEETSALTRLLRFNEWQETIAGQHRSKDKRVHRDSSTDHSIRTPSTGGATPTASGFERKPSRSTLGTPRA
jgi:hypothetical protein